MLEPTEIVWPAGGYSQRAHRVASHVVQDGVQGPYGCGAAAPPSLSGKCGTSCRMRHVNSPTHKRTRAHAHAQTYQGRTQETHTYILSDRPVRAKNNFTHFLHRMVAAAPALARQACANTPKRANVCVPCGPPAAERLLLRLLRISRLPRFHWVSISQPKECGAIAVVRLRNVARRHNGK